MLFLLMSFLRLAMCYENPMRGAPSRTALIDQLIKDIEGYSNQFEKLKSSGFLDLKADVDQPK